MKCEDGSSDPKALQSISPLSMQTYANGYGHQQSIR